LFNYFLTKSITACCDKLSIALKCWFILKNFGNFVIDNNSIWFEIKMVVMESNESEKLLLLNKELEQYIPLFERVLIKVRDTPTSNYPIFVLHQEQISIGVALINKESQGGKWNIRLSFLEEFAAQGLIRPERVEDFQALYVRKENHYCLFVLSELGAQFIFLPRVIEA